MAANRMVIPERPSAMLFLVGFFFCFTWPMRFLAVSKEQSFNRQFAAQVVIWFGMAVAGWRMNRRDKESEAVEVEVPIA